MIDDVCFHRQWKQQDNNESEEVDTSIKNKDFNFNNFKQVCENNGGTEIIYYCQRSGGRVYGFNAN